MSAVATAGPGSMIDSGTEPPAVRDGPRELAAGTGSMIVSGMGPVVGSGIGATLPAGQVRTRARGPARAQPARGPPAQQVVQREGPVQHGFRPGAAPAGWRGPTGSEEAGSDTPPPR